MGSRGSRINYDRASAMARKAGYGSYGAAYQAFSKANIGVPANSKNMAAWLAQHDGVRVRAGVSPTGIKDKGTIEDIKQIALDYNTGGYSDKDVQDILMRYEAYKGENYDDMYSYFAGLTGKKRKK